jgi:hypothetical protein
MEAGNQKELILDYSIRAVAFVGVDPDAKYASIEVKEKFWFSSWIQDNYHSERKWKLRGLVCL